MMQQYRELKARDPGALLLFRMGDFYELFGEDAERASALLGLTLTTRDRDKGADALPMAGFPYHQLEPYLGRLVAQGVRAAVCEQIEDPKLAKGLVKRDIVRVVTPGTLTDDALLDPRAANYLAAVTEIRGKLGLAWVELSTAQFRMCEVSRTGLIDEVTRIEPAELLVSETMLEAPWLRTLRGMTRAVFTARPSWDFVHEQAHALLLGHFGTATLSGFGVEDGALPVSAAGALVAYLKETQRAALGHLHRIEMHRPAHTLGLDAMTRRSLELTRTLRDGKREGTLLDSIDQTITPMGARLLAEWLGAPLTSVDAIRQRQSAVEELLGDGALRQELRHLLGRAFDLERLAARVGTGRATPRDLGGLARTLAILPRIKALITSRSATRLNELEAALELCPEIRQAIEAALVDDPPLTLKEGGLIRAGYHPDLDQLRDDARGGKSWIARFQADLIQRTGISGLKVGFNKVFGYYLEITHAQAAGRTLPDEFIRKQTIKNAERYITPELKEYEDRVLRAEERARDLEYELFVTLRDRVSAEAPRLIQAGGVLAQLDVLAALAELAASRHHIRPEIVAEPALEIEAGRHPVLESLLPAGSFVPNDVRLAPDEGMVLLITGPNMAGKSTYIRQSALLLLMAQIGAFLPVKRARIGVADRLFARVGATDELSRGLSTFMVEMTETANILHNATKQSLVILDEVGRGTSTFDGVSLAWAITEWLHDEIKCRTLFATHYHELVDLENTRPHLRNANVAVREHGGEIAFLHRIAPGGADQSYGIHVAKLAGVPAPVLARATEILKFLESQHVADASADGRSTERRGPTRKVKSGRALQGSLFASLPDPILAELRELDPRVIDPAAAIALLARLKECAAE